MKTNKPTHVLNIAFVQNLSGMQRAVIIIPQSHVDFNPISG